VTGTTAPITVHSTVINGLTVKTGDLLCTVAGEEGLISGHFWWVIGRLLPGAVDHIVIYTGPGRRCVESAVRGVTTFDLPGDTWEPREMFDQRGPLLDWLYGVVSPLDSVNWSEARKDEVRAAVGAYCLAQAANRKPYNFNFMNPETESAFYCSQLAYLAYKPHGINLNTNTGISNIPGTSAIVFPQEIWDGLPNRRALQP